MLLYSLLNSEASLSCSIKSIRFDCIAELPTWKGANYLDDDGRNNNDDGKAEKGECSLANIFKSTLLQTPSYCKKASSLTAQHD